jgi:hypothetical protein
MSELNEVTYNSGVSILVSVVDLAQAERYSFEVTDIQSLIHHLVEVGQKVVG